jgi:hypothetical protein
MALSSPVGRMPTVIPSSRARGLFWALPEVDIKEAMMMLESRSFI